MLTPNVHITAKQRHLNDFPKIFRQSKLLDFGIFRPHIHPITIPPNTHCLPHYCITADDNLHEWREHFISSKTMTFWVTKLEIFFAWPNWDSNFVEPKLKHFITIHRHNVTVNCIFVLSNICSGIWIALCPFRENFKIISLNSQ